MNPITPKLRRNLFLQLLVLVQLTPGLVLWTNPVMANPSGANIVAGSVNFQGMGTKSLNINNLTNGGNGRAIINWQNFSIDKGEVTTINQGAQGFTLNRVVSGNPTNIYGQLKSSQGGVAVVNPNGIVVHSGGSVDVAGMLALSTLDVQNKEFLKGGSMRFRGSTAAAVRNYGTITSSDGDVVLMGNFLENAGTVNAPRGVVAFGAGGDIIVDQAGGAKISVMAGGKGGAKGIVNSGEINAAAAELKAHGNVYALAIQNTGLVRASGYQMKGGRLTLNAGPQGRIVNTGQLSARNADGSGGQIRVSGGQVELGSQVATADDPAGMASGLVDATGEVGRGGDIIVEGSNISVARGAVVDASGQTGGGNVQIGGGFQGRDSSIRNADTLTIDDGASIRATATDSGRGGNIILWSDGDTLFTGELSVHGVSQGGFAEVSGRRTLIFDGDVDLGASGGNAGTLLLDPTDVSISSAPASANNINNVTLSDQLDKGVNVIISTNFGSATESGTIAVNDRVEWYQQDAATTPGTLTLLAMGDILFNRSVRSAGTGGINVVAGWDGVTGFSSPITGPQSAGVFNMSAVLATLNDGNAANDAAGRGTGLLGQGGSVFVNTQAGTEFVEVGSRFGDTKIAGRDLLLMAGTTGDDRWAMVGFRDSGVEYELGRTYLGAKNEWWGNAAGNVQNKNYIAMLGGTAGFGTGDTGSLGDRAFKGAGYGATGGIEIGLSGRLDMRGADNRTTAFVQIGHGGSMNGEPGSDAAYTTRDGFVLQPKESRYAFSSTWRTNYLGQDARIKADIRIEAGGDVYISAARGFEPGFMDMVTADSATGHYALVGHGGFGNSHSGHGDITVIAHGATTLADGRGLAGAGIQLRGGNGTGAFAAIGHSSDYNNNGKGILDKQRSGNITVIAETGAVRMLGFNLLPREGTTVSDRNTGRLLGVNEELAVGSAMDNAYYYSAVHIGHGGGNGTATTDKGMFTLPAAYVGPGIVRADGSVVSTDVGTPVTLPLPDDSMSGDITVYAGGTVKVRDNMGYDASGNWISDPGPGVDPYFLDGGGVVRDVGIEIRAPNQYVAEAQIGHGGNDFRATSFSNSGFTGNIRVEAAKGGILAIGGEERRSSDERYPGTISNLQVGHGGNSSFGNLGGSITVLAGQSPGALKSDIIFRTGRMSRTWAQIGHGGYDATGYILDNSPIVVKANGDVELTSRLSGPSDINNLSADFRAYYTNNANSSATLGTDTETTTGVLASGTQSPLSDIIGKSWPTDYRWAQIGHGGRVNYNGVFSKDNPITVEAQTGNLRMTSGNDNYSWTQIGMGGVRGGGAPQIVGSDITILAAKDLIVDASNPGGTREERTSMFGAVYRDSAGNLLGVGQTNTIGRGTVSYGMIGNGGYDMDGDNSGNINMTVGGDFIMLAAQAGNVYQVNGWEGPYIEGASGTGTAGANNRNPWIGKRHTLDALTEASMMQRTFQLYHGTEGTAELANKGAIVPTSVKITVSGGTITDTNGDGKLFLGTDVVGSVDYSTGLVTMNSTAKADGIVESSMTATNRTVAYQYVNPSSTTITIALERTPESDTAVRPADAFLGHGRIIRGTVELKIGSNVYTDPGLNGNIVDSNGAIIATIDYTFGFIRFKPQSGGVAPNSAGDKVTANYQWTDGYAQNSSVSVGNGGPASGVGGRDTIGSTGDITMNVGGDVRVHSGAFEWNYSQIGNGGHQTQSAHSGNITINAGGIVEFMGGEATIDPTVNRYQYTMLGHGGYDSDGSHKGNITVNAGSGQSSPHPAASPELVGGGATAGLILKGGSGADSGAQIGHGGRSAPAGAATQLGLDPDQAGRFTGDITIRTQGAIKVLAGTMTAINLDKVPWTEDGRINAQIGHGGYDAGVNGGTNLAGYGHIGKISVIAGKGDIEVLAGSLANGSAGGGYGRVHTAQIGHGGYSADGSHDGNIEVIAEDGSIRVKGGDTLDNDSEKWGYARIGHAADNAPGDAGKAGDTIKVFALGGDIELGVGDARKAGAQIGNGGYLGSGQRTGDIQLIAARNLIMDGTVDPTIIETGVKIGHGDQLNRGGGTWDGSIDISLGDSLKMTKAQIGHLETEVALPSSPVYGHTYIAVGRNNPYGNGTGGVYTDADSRISSAGGGIMGEELRIYMPSAAGNHIANGTYLNSADYNRVPAPGSGRADEQQAMEHQFPATGPTEADAQFTPEGPYPFQSFGLYNIYYGGVTIPPTPPTPPVIQPGNPTIPLPGMPDFYFGPYVFDQTYDAFFRYEDVFNYDGYDTILGSMALAEAMESDAPLAVGRPFIEQVLDGVFGPRNDGAIAPGSSVLDEEKDEELLRRQRRAAAKVGRSGLTYYVFDPGTNRYSSFRLFGVDQSRLSVTQ